MKSRGASLLAMILFAGGCSSRSAGIQTDSTVSRGKTVAAEQPVRRLATPSITFGKTIVAHEGVTLNWEIDTSTADNESPARVVRYEVERKPAGSDSWTTVSDALSPTATSHTDATVKSKKQYVYRLTCYFANAGSTTPPAPDRIGKTSATTTPVKTVSVFRLKFSSAKKDQVFAKIEKYERTLGRWVKKNHTHHAGDSIGWWKDIGGTLPTPIHLVSVGGGRTVPVNFNTGMTLVSVEKAATIDIDKCLPIYAPGGKWTGCNRTKVTVALQNIYTIVYADDQGERVAYYPDPLKNSLVMRKACKNHGGTGDFTRVLYANDPLKLLALADRLWPSDPEKAILIYKRLLAEFADTAPVRVSRTRIRLRAEQGD